MTPLPIETIRAELEAQDAAIVRILLGVPDPAGESASHPEDGTARRFPALWCDLAGAYNAFLPPGFPAASAPVLRTALWRRIASGARVVEAKRHAAPERFAEAVRRGDRAALLRQITHPDVERRVIRRAAELAARLQHPEAQDTVAALFRDLVIPMTRAFQIEWLLAPPAAGIPPGKAPP